MAEDMPRPTGFPDQATLDQLRLDLPLVTDPVARRLMANLIRRLEARLGGGAPDRPGDETDEPDGPA